MITKLGDYLRTIRINNQQILKNMADVLHVSSAFLSAVENGKKTMPESWYPILKANYSLTADEMDELRQAALESQKTISLNISKASAMNRQAAVSFAREFESMDDSLSGKILSLLRDHRSKEKGDSNGE
ncbi:MAG: hypothetical protein IKW95_08825 [Lachnospiraceae bacterium]|nr:hypothetical protein [Lachnospiraceae bacterium]